MEANELILYQPDETLKLDVRVEGILCGLIEIK